MEIDKDLYNQIKAYCAINNLKVGKYINDLLKDAFMLDKYGDRPPMFIPKKEKVDETVKEPEIQEKNCIVKKVDVVEEKKVEKEEQQEPKTFTRQVKINTRKLN